MAAAVRGDVQKEYVLAELRLARKYWPQLLANKVEAIGVALRGNVIDSEAALAWLQKAEVLDLLGTVSDGPGLETPSEAEKDI